VLHIVLTPPPCLSICVLLYVSVYACSIPECKLVEHFFYELAAKFPATKFLKSISSVCIPDYPDKNLPTVFVYRDSELQKQFIGPAELGGTNLTQDGQYVRECSSPLLNICISQYLPRLKHMNYKTCILIGTKRLL